jgi:hypothetical protein
MSEVILTTTPGKYARISQNIEERVPRRWYRKGLSGPQVLVVLVCRFEERCVGLPHALMCVAPDDTSAAAEIKACCTIAEGEQGRRGLRVTGFHQNAPCRSFRRRRGDADLGSLGGESLVSQSRVHLTADPISTNPGRI